MASSPLTTLGRALRRWHWLLWLTTVAGGGLALAAASHRAPTYQATALLYLNESQNVNQGFDLALQADQYLTQRYLAMATSQPLLSQVCSQEGPGCSPAMLSRKVTATTPKATGQIAITVSSASPNTAARLANEVAQALVSRNQAQVVASLASQRQLLQQQLDQLNRQMAATQQAIQAADALWRPNSGPVAQFAMQQSQYTATFNRLQDLDARQAQLIGSLTVEQPAAIPTKPSDPDPLRYGVVGAIGGLAAGFMAALLAERFRDRIFDGAELAEATGSPLVLAVDGRDASAAIGTYSLAARADGQEQSGGVQLLLVAASPNDPVDEIAMDLAEAVAADQRRVLVVPAAPGGVGRKTPEPSGRRQTSDIVVLASARPLVQAPERASNFDLTIRCVAPLARAPLWLNAAAGPAVLVATRGKTRFSDARRASDLLRYVGLRPAAAILLKRHPDGSLRQQRRRKPRPAEIEASAS
jgi:capsular polysaccharide biosynthesis protein